MKIDIHCHTSNRSRCGSNDEEAMIEYATHFGLDALAFTDHRRLPPPDRLAELNELYAPFRIFNGIETGTKDGLGEIVVLGVADPEIEKAANEWTYAELHTFVRERNGFISVAHPFRIYDEIGFDVDAYPPDAIEMYSNNIKESDIPRIQSLCDHLGCYPVAVSDAHSTLSVGTYYIDIDGTPETDEELTALLRAGSFECAWAQHRIDAMNRAYIRNPIILERRKQRSKTS